MQYDYMRIHRMNVFNTCVDANFAVGNLQLSVPPLTFLAHDAAGFV